jgi:hypothetical protein
MTQLASTEPPSARASSAIAELSDSSAGVAQAPRSAPTMPWWQGWIPLAVLPWIVVLFAPDDWPPWAVMWTLAFTIFCGCKWLTWRRTPVDGVPPWRHAAYLLLWPGLDPAAFLGPRSSSAARRPASREWLFAVVKLLIGLSLLYGVVRWVPTEYPYLTGWVGMVGTIMVLHFGSFHLLSYFWRSVGMNARPLMHAPLTSVSLGEFWGRRWNTAFRDLTHRFLFRPLTARLGARGAVLAGFVFSGIVHDVVISVPAGGGYGGPSLFFMLQALGILAERSRAGKQIGLGKGWRGGLFAMLLLVLPAPLLFHPPFVERIVVPFLGAIGAI